MFGKYTHNVDAKGRLFVPAKLREELGETFYVMVGTDHCLLVFPEEKWQTVNTAFQDVKLSKSAALRYLYANLAKCEPDKQGRFLIPQILRDYGFSFFDLTDCSPKAGKTKDQCGKAIAVIMLLEHPPLMEKLRASKMLPIRELSLASGVSRKVIERHRKYIIACAEILSGDFPILGTYLSYVRELARQDG